MASRGCYEFGEFLLEAEERRLSCAGQPIPLAPKTLDLLVVLVRRAGGLVTKRELLAQVWPEAIVEEGILSVHISALRRALNGRGGTRSIVGPQWDGLRAGARFLRCLGRMGLSPVRQT